MSDNLGRDIQELPEHLQTLVVLGMLSGMSRREVVDAILVKGQTK